MVSPPQPIQVSITEFWDTVAPFYEGHPGNTVPIVSGAYERWVELFQRLLPPPPTDVLDLCTGTGFAALICASLGHKVTGADLAPSMLNIARGIAAGRGLPTRFVEADAVAPPFEEATFDVVVSRHSLWTLRTPDQALRNWYRLLRSGGRIVAIDAFHSWDVTAPKSEEDKFFLRHYTSSVQAALPFMQLQSMGPLLAALKEAQFRDVQFEFLAEDLSESEGHREYALIAYR
jgi:ubiquinone/menaquinone biosynthesis C-methylase UbiE